MARPTQTQRVEIIPVSGTKDAADKVNAILQEAANLRVVSVAPITVDYAGGRDAEPIKGSAIFVVFDLKS